MGTRLLPPKFVGVGTPTLPAPHASVRPPMQQQQLQQRGDSAQQQTPPRPGRRWAGCATGALALVEASV